MTWYLIMTIYSSSGAYVAPAIQLLPSLSACQAAGASIYRQLPPDARIKFECVQLHKAKVLL
jgi:hypothetical protein